MNGKQLKSCIKELGITHEQAAGMLGISRRTLSNWFGLDELDANTMHAVQKTLQITQPNQCAEQTSLYETILLPISAHAGSLASFSESVDPMQCERIVSPIKNTDYAITVSGDSMEPEYPSGSKILIKKINEQAFIEWGRCYVLDTCNGTIVKKLMPSKQADKLQCVSTNINYPPFDVSMSDIYGVYRVMMMLSEK